MYRLLVMLLLLPLLLVLATPAPGQSYTIWHSPIGIRTADSSLDIQPGIPSVATRITASSTGTAKWIHVGLIRPDNVEVDSLTVCYETTSSNVFISQTRISRMTTPDAASVLSDDGTDQTDPGPTCYTIPLTGVTVGSAGMYLQLRLEFAATAGEYIEIGAVGLHVTETGSSSPGGAPGLE